MNQNQIIIGTAGKAKPRLKNRFWKGSVIAIQPIMFPEDGAPDHEVLFHPNYRRVSDFWTDPDRFVPVAEKPKKA